MDLLAEGWLRLPLAKGTACSSCIKLTNETVLAEGNLSLAGLRRNPDNTLQGQMGGDLSAIRLDETVVAPAVFLGLPTIAAAAATAGAAFLLKFLLAPFFTRLTKAEALEHPRRKAIFEHIQRNPGTSFRETARTVGIAAGTVRHHLNVLERAGMVVERPHGATVRFFEQKDSDADWVSVVMLREPALKVLHDWLKQHPGSPQTGVLEAMEEQGWSRSTTQHRLSRLVDSGLVAIKLQGRYKMYSVADRPPSSGDGRPIPMAPTPSA
ncbi:MAG: winged helix-turn-helix transcriptional regulator [Thermoplasmatota archaeon]